LSHCHSLSSAVSSCRDFAAGILPKFLAWDIAEFMISWWEPGNQIVSAVLSNPFNFGDFLGTKDIIALSVACTSTQTICKWIIKSIRESLALSLADQ
jgi:hypothetical protein